MTRESGGIFSVAAIMVIVGTTLYFNRKKIKMLLTKKVCKITEKDADFLKEIGAQCRRKQRQPKLVA